MYVVVENTPGYLPESDPVEFETWKEACDYAKELAGSVIEDADARVRRYYTSSAHNQDEYGIIRVWFPDEPHDLGWVVEITKT